jgi:hypothetical protein
VLPTFLECAALLLEPPPQLAAPHASTVHDFVYQVKRCVHVFVNSEKPDRVQHEATVSSARAPSSNTSPPASSPWASDQAALRTCTTSRFPSARKAARMCSAPSATRNSGQLR